LQEKLPFYDKGIQLKKESLNKKALPKKCFWERLNNNDADIKISFAKAKQP